MMIEKLDEKLAGNINSFNMSQNIAVVLKAINKINELVDAVNSIVSVQEKLIDSRFVVETKHEEPADPYAEQRKWIGKLCWFWDISEEYKFVGILGEVADNGTYFQKDGIMSYSNCEPVKPDSDIIYKGE